MSWKVKVGDTVKVNDVIVEIETAKSLVELPCPFAGVVEGLLVEEGATVPVGTPIIAVEVGLPALLLSGPARLRRARTSVPTPTEARAGATGRCSSGTGPGPRPPAGVRARQHRQRPRRPFPQLPPSPPPSPR